MLNHQLPALKAFAAPNRKSPKLDLLQSVKQYLLKERFEAHYKSESPKAEANIIFLLDTSGSMAVGAQMAYVKGLVAQTLKKQRHKKIHYAMILLQNSSATIAQAFTPNTQLITQLNYNLRTGGKTNLGDAFKKVHSLSRGLDKHTLQLFTFTDGKANVGCEGTSPFAYAVSCYKKYVGSSVKSTIIDTEKGFVQLGRAKALAKELKLNYTKLQSS